ncbi:LamG-like jellyroll fold domain-containing protein [Anaerosporobacter sp.]|uniref:LamG-like jellyroll fold domain-containing protein n=1 Tax=Anaerosporobacter sp. TaxID=1872529 RepID=UPI00286F3AD0|nr:glycoside hydrolase family 43 C-terminal domain-containing protein [Anaerosporobacter sp.]
MRRKGFAKRTLALVLTAALVLPQSNVLGTSQVVVKAEEVSNGYAVEPDYLYGFDDGTVTGTTITSQADTATIVGGGSIVNDTERGKVFDNNSTGTSALRTDYLSLPQVLEGATEGFTVSMYVKSVNHAESYWGAVFNAYKDSQETPLTQVGFNLIGRVKLNGDVETTDGTSYNTSSYDLMTDGNWHQVAYAVKANEISVYCDGNEISKLVLEGSEGAISSSLFTSLSQLTNINVGGNCFWNDNDVNAYFDDIAIYHSYLTATEVQNNSETPKYLYTFEDGTVSGTKISNTMSNATIVGQGQATTDSERGQVFSNYAETAVATGKQNYIDLPAIFNNVTVDKGFTVSAWVKKGSADLGYWGDIFVASNNGNSTMTKLGINMIARINAINGLDDTGEFVDLEDGTLNNEQSYGVINDGKWHQVAYTVSNNMIAVYIDCERIASKTLDASTVGATYGSFFNDIPTLNQISFGGNSLWGNPDPDINGYFDDISFYSKALTTSQLQLNYVAQGGVIEEEDDIEPTTSLSDADIASLYQIVSKTRNSVHDPSIVVSTDENGKKLYSVFGSHMGVSKTYDLMNWTSVTGETLDSTLFADASGKVVSYEEAFKQNRLTGTTTLYKENGETYTVDFGTYDVADWISSNTVQGNMWAPDVVYNEVMGKWCMYLSMNGNDWHSSIVLLTADKEFGPYVYEAPIVFSGFTNSESKSYKKTDLEIALKTTLSELPAKYSDFNGENWGEYLPHAIDPCVFYDEAGKLWMAYGSWSGGIFMLELDEKTGLRDYSVVYDNVGDGTKDVTSDAYFGKKIAGGQYVSGEGSYIEKIGDYYFLFMSYGFYSPEGGYVMRIFRSENPNGPYVDTNGTNAIFTTNPDNFNGIGDNRGMKLMGNYKWNTMSVGEVAQGHNSAFVDSDGKAYLVYHTKFDDGTAGHQLRVHQLYLNEDGWIVAAPYEYAEETISATGYDSADIVGSYDMIVHKYKVDFANLETVKPVKVTLNADGTITGAYEGTWTEVDGTAYCNLVMGSKTYKGVFAKQTIDETNVETMCFTAVNGEGLSIWGSKYLADDIAVACNVQQTSVPLGAFSSFTLPTKGQSGAKYKWQSSNEAVLANDGTVTTPSQDTDVTLTMTLYKGDYYYTHDYTVTVYANRSDYEDAYLIGSYFENDPQDLTKTLDGSLYVRNPFCNDTNVGINIENGITIEFDVERTGDIRMLGTILSMMGGSGRLYFTPGSYLGYNAAGSYFDANVNSFTLVEDYIGASSTVAININKDGFSVSVDGKEVYNEEIIGTENGGGTVASYANVLSWINGSADKLYFGYGSWWNAAGYDEANCKISNVKCYVEPGVTYASGAIYEMDYSEVTDATTKWKSEGSLTIKNNIENGNYVEFTATEAKSAYSQLPKYARVKGKYSVECDIALQTGSKVGTEFAILGTDKQYKSEDANDGVNSGYVLKLTKTGESTWKVNGKDEITLPNTWVHVTAVTSSNGVVVVTITDASKTYYDSVVAVSGSGVLDGFYLRSTGNTDTMLIDNIKVTNTDTHFSIDKAVLETSSDITQYSNPFYGKKLEIINVSYTINWAEDAAKNGWDGIFAFFNTANNNGRVSFQTLPYLCYNGGGKWMDINHPESAPVNTAATLEKGKDYTFNYVLTRDSIEIYADGTLLEYVTTGDGTFADILNYIAACDKITIGVGKSVSAFWDTEKCTLTNLDINDHVCKEYGPLTAKEASCTEDGIHVESACSCGKSTVTPIASLGGHNYGDWVVVEEPTYTTIGHKEKTCSGCGDVISEIIDKLVKPNEPTNTSEDTTKEETEEVGEVTQVIEVVVDGLGSKAKITITKDKDGNVIEAVADIYLADVAMANNMATVVLNEKLVNQILKEVADINVWNIVINEDAMKDAIALAKKGKGTQLQIIIPANTELSSKNIVINGKAISEAKAAGEKLVVQVIEGKNQTYTITFSKAELKKAAKTVEDINVEVNVTKQEDGNVALTFAEEGTLSVPASIKVKVSNLLKADAVYVYKMNPTTGKLEEVPNNKKTVSGTGYITVSTLTGGTFIISAKEIKTAVKLTDKVTLTSSKTSVTVGKTLNLKAVLPAELALVTKFTSGDPCGKEEAKVTYSVSNKNIATISANGKLTAKKAGKVTVKITILLENKQKRVISKTITVK